jgi:hypothetical protein
MERLYIIISFGGDRALQELVTDHCILASSKNRGRVQISPANHLID